MGPGQGLAGRNQIPAWPPALGSGPRSQRPRLSQLGAGASELNGDLGQDALAVGRAAQGRQVRPNRVHQVAAGGGEEGEEDGGGD